MKIIELFIDNDADDEAGVGAISLVDRPAHESNFLTFSEDTMVEDTKETEYTYISELFDEDKQLQLSKLMNTLGEPAGTLESQGWEIVSVKDVHSFSDELKFNKFYNIIGTPNEKSGEDSIGSLRVRYKYIGPRDDKNRQFCSDMLSYKRVFRIEDIQEMTADCTNKEFGCYDIFTWRGSYNCRHKFVQVLYRPVGAITGNLRPVQVNDIPQESTLNTATANKRNMSEEPLIKNEFGILSIIDGQPLFSTKEDALKMAELLGCDGFHEHQVGDTTGYMACKTHEFQSYNDYPQAATDAACKVLRWIEEYGRDEVDGMTQVGLARANQLCNKEPISIDTISRMASFARHKQNSKISPEFEGTPWKDRGYVAWLGWGDDEGIEWAQRKLEQLKTEMAEVGERGGIVKTPKAPKSDTPNKNPQGEGTAKGDASTTRGAEVPKSVEETLQKKSDDFNERYKDKLGYGVNLGMLKSVYQRGVGAYNVSHSPEVSSSQQWALARVNAFLYLVKEGRPENKKYTTDYDLLPTKHPKKEDMDSISGISDGGGCGCMDIDVSGISPYTDETTTGITSENVFRYGFSYDEEKMEITGASIIPNKMIIRRNPMTDEIYYVYFSKETTKILSERFMKNKLTDSTNLNHSDIEAPDTFVSESWLVIDPANDKSSALGLNYPEGTWVITMKVNSPTLWNEIKEGKYKGYSIEGYFNERVVFN